MNSRKLFLLLGISLLLVSCAHKKGNVDRFYFGPYSEAEKLYGKGDYEKAIVKYQAYIDENPEGNLAVISEYYIAKSHAALGHADQAKTIYQEIIEKHPDLVWAKFAETQLKELDGKSSPAPLETPAKS